MSLGCQANRHSNGEQRKPQKTGKLKARRTGCTTVDVDIELNQIPMPYRNAGMDVQDGCGDRIKRSQPFLFVIDWQDERIRHRLHDVARVSR